MLLKRLLENIITRAREFNLPAEDILNSREYLDNNEFALCLDTIVTQLYEHDIKIDQEFYLMAKQTAEKLQLPVESVEILKSLILPNQRS
jgi:hypothetical protein